MGPGEVVSKRYRIERVLGSGLRGTTYLARHLEHDASVALKIFKSRGSAAHADLSQRFVLEATTVARLIHPNIGSLYDYGETEDAHPYLVMELVPGRPLSTLIPDVGYLPIARVLEIGVQIARALRAAHGLNITHGDLEPGAVFVAHDGTSDDDVKLIDFGLGSVFGRGARWAQYAAPELLRDERVRPRSDVYSLGVALYEMIAGVVPYPGNDIAEVVRHALHGLPPIASTGNRRPCPVELEGLIAQCLEHSPERRPRSSDDLVAELKSIHRKLTGSTKYNAARTSEIESLKKN